MNGVIRMTREDLTKPLDVFTQVRIELESANEYLSRKVADMDLDTAQLVQYATVYAAIKEAIKQAKKL